MRIPLAAVAALVGLAAPPVRAEPYSAPVLALRLGIAPAFGSAAADVPVSEAARFQFPVQLDALWRVGPAAAGGYGSWGISTSGRCQGLCAWVARAGLQATWTFAARSGPEAWAGVAAGYEWAAERQGDVTTTWRGFEILGLQGGVEWRVAPALALGPFVLVSAGRYTDVALDTPVESASGELARRAVHVWLHAGVRARLILGGAR